jgi:hypothetical protein
MGNLKLQTKNKWDRMRSAVLAVFVINFVSQFNTLTGILVKSRSVTHPTTEHSNYTNIILNYWPKCVTKFLYHILHTFCQIRDKTSFS